VITKLTDEIEKLKLRESGKVLAKPPPVFDGKKQTFHTWASFAKNYFIRTGTDPSNYVGLLLTYLSPNDYSAVSRVYNMDDLAERPYDKAAEAISHIISDKVDQNKAVSRLMKLKQGNLSIQQFLDRLSEMAEIGFPEENMQSAKRRCLTSALQSNVRSKLLSYEIHRYMTENPNISFEDLSLKVLELEKVLAGENSEDEESGTLNILNVVEQGAETTQIKQCFVCKSTSHLRRNCPQKFRAKRCYVCRSYNHLQKDCPHNSRAQYYKECYECQSPYHLKRDCPYLYQQTSSSQYDHPDGTYEDGNIRHQFGDHQNVEDDSVYLAVDDEQDESNEKKNEEVQPNIQYWWED
jgi:hypothetical protein